MMAGGPRPRPGRKPANSSAAIDLHSNHITVSSVELAERERLTAVLRETLKKVGQERTALAKELAETKQYTKRLEAKLTAGGLAAAYAKLDDKCKSLQKTAIQNGENYRRATAEARELLQMNQAYHEALELRADELDTNVDTLLEAARGGAVLRSRDNLIRDLQEKYEAAEVEAQSRKEEAVTLAAERDEHAEACRKYEEKVGALVAEVRALGASKEELLAHMQDMEEDRIRVAQQADQRAKDAAAELAALRREVEVLQGKLSTATKRAEGAEKTVKEQQVYAVVMERQLSEERARCQELTKELSEAEPSRTQEKAMQFAQATAMVQSLTKQVEQLQEDKQAADRRCEEEIQHSRELVTKLQTALVERQRFEDELSAAQSELQKLRTQATDAARLRKEYHRLTAELSEVREDRDRLDAQLHQAQLASSKLHDDLAAREAEVKRLRLLNEARRKPGSSAASSSSPRHSVTPPLPPPPSSPHEVPPPDESSRSPSHHLSPNLGALPITVSHDRTCAQDEDKEDRSDSTQETRTREIPSSVTAAFLMATTPPPASRAVPGAPGNPPSPPHAHSFSISDISPASAPTPARPDDLASPPQQSTRGGSRWGNIGREVVPPVDQGTDSPLKPTPLQELALGL